jgi:hypothetical protein
MATFEWLINDPCRQQAILPITAGQSAARTPWTKQLSSGLIVAHFH